MSTHPLANKAAKGISYFTPEQDPPAGTAIGADQSGTKIPKLFQPLRIRDLVLQNRIFLSPLCQYSADDGHHTPWHMAHLGGIISRGTGLAFVEATAVTAEGRITPEDAGLWKDSQIEPFRKEVEFAHSQSQKIGIQLAHAGRKASTAAPWISPGDTVGPELNGWPDNVWAPSPLAYNDRHPMPKEMSIPQIEQFKADFIAAVKRALKAGFDCVEIHSAHGYLLHSFLSPKSNIRSDRYGGSFDNRIRLLLEVAELTRAEIPAGMPLFVRISGTDWLDGDGPDGVGDENKSWTMAQTVRLAPLLAERGVDVLDVSSGGLHPDQKPKTGPGYQSFLAKAVKDAVGEKLIVGTVGSITSGVQANDLLEKDNLDLVFVGRAFQKNPGLVFFWGEELGLNVQMPNQIRWGFGGRGKKKTAQEKKL